MLIRILLFGTGLVFPYLSQAGDLPGAEQNANEAADAPRTKHYVNRQSYWNRYIGDLYLSGGFSHEFNYNSQLGGKMVLDYMVDDQVSIGAHTAAYQLKTDGGKFASNYVGIRLSYHLLKAKLYRRKAHWNVYTGVSADIEIGGAEKDWHEKRIFADLHFGTRYRLGQKFFLWGEANITNVNIGFTIGL